MRPWQSLTRKDAEEECSCIIPCVMFDDGYEEWKANASLDDQTTCVSTNSGSTFSSNIRSRSSRTNTLKGLYRPRSGLSARVRFILPVASYLSGDFDLLPPSIVKENRKSTKALKRDMFASIFKEKSLLPETSMTPSSILRMENSVLPEKPNEMWMNIDHEEQEENLVHSGMILVVSPSGVELQESRRECRTIGDFADEEDSFDDDEISDTRDVPFDVAVPTTTISEDDISRIYDEPDIYIMRADKKQSATKVATPHGSFLLLIKRVRRVVRERGAYKVFRRHGRERFEI